MQDTVYNAIDKIARGTGADAWFMLSFDDEGGYSVLDFEEGDEENGYAIDTREGFQMLAEAISEPFDFYGLTDDEAADFMQFIKDFGIDFEEPEAL